MVALLGGVAVRIGRSRAAVVWLMELVWCAWLVWRVGRTAVRVRR
jgi:hypothetical protein